MTKIIFNIINTIFIILYIYPGSILGLLIYGEIQKQPQITPDFIFISSNHVYAFLLISFTGMIAYYKSNKSFIIYYLLLISIFLEFLHLVIPNRSFEYGDLFGNIIGVILTILLFNIFISYKKK